MKRAFTLTEVLITLGIIGVIAAITIPGLVTTYKAYRLRTQFFKSYATIQQVVKQMEADGLSVDPLAYGTRSFYKVFMNYLKSPLSCETPEVVVQTDRCFTFQSKPYRNFAGSVGSRALRDIIDDGQIILPDGTNLFFENYVDTKQLFISVDLNGYASPPNRFGYDLFTFQLTNEGELKVMGDKNTQYTNMESYCQPDPKKAPDALNGISCAYRAKTEADYFQWLVKNIK